MTHTCAKYCDGYEAIDYTLDDIGNVVALDESLPAGPATCGIAYDDRGRHSQYLSGTRLKNTYHFNGRGERVAKLNVAAASNIVYFVYDEAGHLLGEYKANGTAIKEYLWLDDTLVAAIAGFQSDRVQYVLTDHLGTPRAAVQPATDAIIWRWDLTGSAFGEHAAQNDPDGDGNAYALNLRYPGQYFDHETGLHYNYFRDYNPTTGRYVQSDPIGLAGGVSTFGYAGANPIMSSDPLGLFTEEGSLGCAFGNASSCNPTIPTYREAVNQTLTSNPRCAARCLNSAVEEEGPGALAQGIATKFGPPWINGKLPLGVGGPASLLAQTPVAKWTLKGIQAGFLLAASAKIKRCIEACSKNDTQCKAYVKDFDEFYFGSRE